MNISSVVVLTQPENTQKLIEELKKLENVDYHFHDEFGRIIATIEAPEVSEEIATLKKIEALKHVISAEMSYAYAEDELEKERSMVGKNDDEILKSLEDENIDIEYSGSVHHRLDKKEQ